MGTNFEEIYCLNSAIEKDLAMARLPIYQYYSLMYKQLLFSITEFIYDCEKKISEFTPYTENEYSFIGDGINPSFNITPSPDIQNTMIYVGIFDEDYSVYVEMYDFTYDDINHILTFDNIPEKDSKIVISFYNIGEFVDVLDIEEKVILAEGMNIPYLERFQNNTRSLIQGAFTNSYKYHSQAEQIKQLKELTLTQWRERVDDLIKKYSYRKPNDGLVKLAARGRPYGN